MLINEQLACALHDGGHQVHVVLPNMAKAFTRSINLLLGGTMALSAHPRLMGMERKLDPLGETLRAL